MFWGLFILIIKIIIFIVYNMFLYLELRKLFVCLKDIFLKIVIFMFLENGFVLEFRNFNIKVLFLLGKLINIFYFYKIYRRSIFICNFFILKNREKVSLFSKMINFFKICIVIGRCFII